LEKQERTIDRLETGNNSHPTSWILESAFVRAVRALLLFIFFTQLDWIPLFHDAHHIRTLRTQPALCAVSQFLRPLLKLTLYNLQNRSRSGWNIPSLDLAFYETSEVIRVCHCRVNAFRRSLEPTHRLYRDSKYGFD